MLADDHFTKFLGDAGALGAGWPVSMTSGGDRSRARAREEIRKARL